MYLLRTFQVFLGVLASLILLDMFILKGKLKYAWIAYANTTSTSPFSTDGQSNYMLLLVIMGVAIGTFILFKVLEGIPEIEDEEEEKIEDEDKIEIY